MGGVAALCLLLAACGHGGTSAGRPTGGTAGSPQPLARVRAVLARDGAALRRKYSALGTGVGSIDATRPHAPDEPVYVIVVFLERQGDVPARPQSVDGVAIRFEAGGRFHGQ